MFIQTEVTPNPATLKFLPDRQVAGQDGLEVSPPQAESISPLAARLFTLDGVERVFLGSDFISVSKHHDHDWQTLKPLVLVAIMEHFLSGEATLLEPAPQDNSDATVDDPVVQQIKDLLDQHVRPVVAMDGGDITFHGFDQGVVYLTMKGACAGCPSSVMTLQMGIERLLRYYLPQVTAVRPV